MSEQRLAAIMPACHLLGCVVAFRLTDIVGYTTLMGKDEDSAFQLIHQNRQLQRSLIEKYHGEWPKKNRKSLFSEQ